MGSWSELKIEIIRKYANAYTAILHKYNLKPIYVDGFAGAGQHISKVSGETIKGSPLEAFEVQPSFSEFHFVDLNHHRAGALLGFAKGRNDTYVYNDDCNKVLLEKIYPDIKSDKKKRALSILDPYGLHLNWDVIETAGKSEQIEIFLNFPVADMHRNVFWHNPSNVDAEDVARMTRFWGDDSWN